MVCLIIGAFVRRFINGKRIVQTPKASSPGAPPPRLPGSPDALMLARMFCVRGLQPTEDALFRQRWYVESVFRATQLGDNCRKGEFNSLRCLIRLSQLPGAPGITPSGFTTNDSSDHNHSPLGRSRLEQGEQIRVARKPSTTDAKAR